MGLIRFNFNVLKVQFYHSIHGDVLSFGVLKNQKCLSKAFWPREAKCSSSHVQRGTGDSMQGTLIESNLQIQNLQVTGFDLYKHQKLVNLLGDVCTLMSALKGLATCKHHFVMIEN